MTGTALNILHVQLGSDLDAALDGAGYRAEVGVHVVRSLGGFALGGVQFEMIVCMNALDYQHLAVTLHFAPGFRYQPSVAGRYFARLQRASEGPGQSACCGRHDVVQGRGVRLVNVGVDPVVLSDLRVHPKKNRCGDMGQICAAQRPLDAFDFDA